MVTDESPLRMLFRPDEIEMLVCGSDVRTFILFYFIYFYEALLAGGGGTFSDWGGGGVLDKYSHEDI